MLLRFLGYDGFVTSKDVVACLRDAGLDIAEIADIEARPRQGSGAVQRLGERDRPALHAFVAHLRPFDRRELRGRPRRGRSGRLEPSGAGRNRGKGRLDIAPAAPLAVLAPIAPFQRLRHQNLSQISCLKKTHKRYVFLFKAAPLNQTANRSRRSRPRRNRAAWRQPPDGLSRDSLVGQRNAAALRV